MKKVNLKFWGTTAHESKQMLYDFLGDDCTWLGDILYGIKLGYLQFNVSVTEILIRENTAVRISTLKSYLPCQIRAGDDGRVFKPTLEQLRGVVKLCFPGADLQFDGVSIDFSYQVYGLGVFRINYSEGNEGASMTARYLPFDIPTLENVGYPERYIDFFKSILHETNITTPPVAGNEFWISVSGAKEAPKFKSPDLQTTKIKVPRAGGGLFIHVGPTTSGKSTSMAAEINYLAQNSAGLIITYESPVEFVYNNTQAPVECFEIGRDIKKNNDYTLEDMIRRHALRKNPSVIMFGEVRTPAEMRMVVDFSNRGHWVFTSMHANSVEKAFGTLFALFKEEPWVLGNALKAIIAHRLGSTPSGGIVPLFEIFMPDDTRLSKISSGDTKEISRSIRDNENNQIIKFEDSVDHLIAMKKILPLERTSLIETTIGKTFEENNKEGQHENH